MPSEWHFVSVHFTPKQASQRLSMAGKATGTSTENRPQWDSNLTLTSIVITFLLRIVFSNTIASCIIQITLP